MKKQWTALEILNATIPFFKKRSILNPRLNAERLLAHILKVDRIGIYLQFERILSNVEIKNFRQLVQRRANGEPLQYILGETEFMGLPFYVEPAVLIPRPETEILVNEALALQPEFTQKPAIIWDIGTGSGCIAVSLAHYWPACQIIASDISDEAIAIAEKNCKLNQVDDRVRLIKHDILKNEPANFERIDIIVSNPPYISNEELKTLDTEIIRYEPHIALTDFADGLLFYEALLRIDFSKISCRYILFEMSGTQTERIMSIVSSQNLNEVTIIKDLNEIPRILKIRIK